MFNLQLKDYYLLNGIKTFIWSVYGKDGTDYAKCNDGSVKEIISFEIL